MNRKHFFVIICLNGSCGLFLGETAKFRLLLCYDKINFYSMAVG